MSTETSIKSFGKALSKEEKKELPPIPFEFYGTEFKAKPIISGIYLMRAQESLAKAENTQLAFKLSEVMLDYIRHALISDKEASRFMKFVAETDEVTQDDIQGLYAWLVSEQSNRPTSK